MDRRNFEYLRDLPGKTISGPIKLSQKQASQPLLTADKISIANTAGKSLLMNINFNPETGSKSINVILVGEGPICRLDVDGTNHEDAGRSHKHAVQDDRSIRRNLRDGVVRRDDLSGKSLRDVFEDFCKKANIVHDGKFEAPDDEGNHA